MANPARSLRDPGIVLLRITIAAMLAIHGIYRIASGGVVPFGGFLDSQGFPFGLAIAWGISIFEVVGAAFLALGRFVTPVAIGFAIQLLCGIWLVHAANGWFVVGGGRNGIEYSVTLIACLVALVIFLPWMLQTLISFTTQLFARAASLH